MAAATRRSRKWLWILPGAIIIAVLVTCAALYALPALGGAPLPPIKIIGQNCGRVHWEPVNSYDPDEGELCLWRAYTSCHTATLVVEFQGEDAGGTDAITVQPKAGRCAVTDAVQGYSNMTPSSSTYQCVGLRQQNGGLLVVGCGMLGDLYLYPRPPEQVGHVCGVLHNDVNRDMTDGGFTSTDTITGIEDCFWNAYVTCTRPATLIYNNDLRSPEPEASGGYEDHTLVVQPSHGSCALTDVVAASDQSSGKYTCASLARTTDGGLAAQGCGKEGDIIIPPAPPPIQ